MNHFIKINNLKKDYGKISALKHVSISLEEGNQYVIRGSSGSGKSTLLYLLAGLDRPSSGEIRVNGKNLGIFNDAELANYRNRFVGLIFQFHFLLSSMNCLSNMLLPAKIGGAYNSVLKKKVLGLSDELGIGHCLKKFPFELSGGEQQRVNIIRSLSLNPKLLLCDEPTGALDSVNSEKVVHLIKKLAQLNNTTLVVVTHDDKIASQFSQEFFIKDGVLE